MKKNQKPKDTVVIEQNPVAISEISPKPCTQIQVDFVTPNYDVVMTMANDVGIIEKIVINFESAIGLSNFLNSSLANAQVQMKMEQDALRIQELQERIKKLEAVN